MESIGVCGPPVDPYLLPASRARKLPFLRNQGAATEASQLKYGGFRHEISLPFAWRTKGEYNAVMARLTCTVEMISTKAGGGRKDLITGEFSGESVFECAHEAIKAWCKMWYWDSSAVLKVKQGDRVWHVLPARVGKWAAKRDGWV
jgi:hypothetical protein